MDTLLPPMGQLNAAIWDPHLFRQATLSLVYIPFCLSFHGEFRPLAVAEIKRSGAFVARHRGVAARLWTRCQNIAVSGLAFDTPSIHLLYLSFLHYMQVTSR